MIERLVFASDTARDATTLARVSACFERGGVVAVPTESSYGLAVYPRSPRGVEAVYRRKGRERGKPLGVVVADLAQAEALGVDVESPGVRAVERLWPAAISLVAPLHPGARGLAAAAGSGSLAIRIPGHEALCALLAALGHGLTATSANTSGAPARVDPRAVAELLRRDDLLLDGGRLPGGAPSTMVNWQDGRLVVLRHGRVTLPG